MATKKTTTFSMRMPEDLNERIQRYATENSCTKAEAMSHFARAGIDLEDNGPASVPAQAAPTPNTDASKEALDKINERLEALQRLPTIESEPPTAIVPADIRDRIQAYSAEHECSEQEALTYYARLGVQMTAEQRPANAADVNELYRRIDVLAQDSHAKTEQLKSMAQMISDIRDYTKPDELELEGELADEAEDVAEEEELTEEERQRIADEHTRKIVSDVMGDYLARQQEAQAALDERQRTNPFAMWVPVLVAVIVSLVIGLVVVITK